MLRSSIPEEHHLLASKMSQRINNSEYNLCNSHFCSCNNCNYQYIAKDALEGKALSMLD
jgi:hypothetical protein